MWVYFWKIWVALKRTFKLFTVAVLKMNDWRHGRCSTVAAVWRRLTAGKVEAGLVGADVLDVNRWWLKAAGAGMLAGKNGCSVPIY